VHRKTTAILTILFFCVLARPSLLPAAGREEAGSGAAARMADLVENGGFALRHRDRLVAGRDLDVPFVPASIVKIVTSLAALEILGPDFRFTTSFYLTADHDLIIQGHGDPLLTSEEVAGIMGRLHQAGVTGIRDIVLDDSLFQLDAMADGAGGTDNPYDAFNGGLVVNFNTINLTVADDGTVGSAEAQTPLLSLMEEIGAPLPPGTHRINITSGPEALADMTLRYVGELFGALAAREGIAGQGEIRRGTVPPGLTPVYRHRSSFSLSEVVGGLLRYSNNFMANQLFLACGARKYGHPATWDKGRRALAAFLAEELELAGRDILLVEGSGLSRRNRLTVAAMLRVLESFRPHARLLKPGEDEHDNRLLKSGTLEGVYSYAGYLRDHDRLDPLVVILNQKENRRDAVLERLENLHRRQSQ